MEVGGSLFFFVLEVRWKATILFYMFLFFVKISWHALIGGWDGQNKY